jgi:hypothetical protein
MGAFLTLALSKGVFPNREFANWAVASCAAALFSAQLEIDGADHRVQGPAFHFRGL